MTTLSIPIPPQTEEFITSFIKKGYASNKADVVRKALLLLEEEEALNSVLKAEQEIKEGKILRGNLRQLQKKIK